MLSLLLRCFFDFALQGDMTGIVIVSTANVLVPSIDRTFRLTTARLTRCCTYGIQKTVSRKFTPPDSGGDGK